MSGIVKYRWKGEISGRAPLPGCRVSHSQYLAGEATRVRLTHIGQTRALTDGELVALRSSRDTCVTFLNWLYAPDERPPIYSPNAFRFKQAAKRAGRFGRLQFRR